jgi:hypothetical protein
VSKVHIVTDSASIIKPSVAEQLGLTVLPLTVRIGDKEYQDGQDLDHEELLLRMARNRIHPEIIGPTVDDFRQTYSQLTRHSNQIITPRPVSARSNARPKPPRTSSWDVATSWFWTRKPSRWD